MMRRTAALSALLVVCAAPSAGCWLGNPDTPVLQADDVRMELPGANGFRAAGERGEVSQMALEVSDDVNGWVAETAVEMSKIIHEVNQHPEDRTDGDWRVYGPHDDEDGADGSWMVRLAGDEGTASYEVFIGRRGASARNMGLLIAGDITVDDNERDGSFSLDFDTFREYADILDGGDTDARYGGKIVVTFQRDTDTEYKKVDIDFDGFFFDDGVDDLNFDGETYLYERDAKGAGLFHFATWSSFDDSEWSGPELERIVVDTRWDADEQGRARGQILEVNGVGDLRHGDIIVNECYASDGGLTWRSINEAYEGIEPGYSFGEESSCVFEESDLGIAE